MNNTIATNRGEVILDANRIVSGLSIGPVFVFRKFSFNIDDYNFKVENTNTEIGKFRKACRDTVEQLKKTMERCKTAYNEEFLDIFESQIAFLADKYFVGEIETYIRKKKRTAAYSVFTIFKKKKEHFLGLENSYFKDRALDIQDLKEKLLRNMFGLGMEYKVAAPSIIFAENLFPSDTVNFNRELILGFITDKGGRTSHAAIIARALNIPYVINDYNLSKVIHSDDFVILDGYNGRIIINPGKKTIKDYVKLKEKYESISVQLQKEAIKPTRTVDGIDIRIMANVEFYHELKEARSVGADGIGLFRTEGIFLGREGLPGEEEQYQLYKKFSEGLGNLPLVLRTIDTGGDKLLSKLEEFEELNPFLGWRGIRFCLDEPEIFKTQLRAILRANVNKNIKILIPMISCLGEIKQTRLLINEAKQELRKKKIAFHPQIEIGIMIETPSAVIMSDVFAGEVDFLSIGTNDLTQYTLAVDRTNSKISKLFNDMHPAVLRLIQKTIEITREKKLEVSICGEMAGHPQAVPILLGLGLRTLSLSPYSIPKIKKIVRLVSLSECKKLVGEILKLPTTLDIVETVNKFLLAKVPDSEILQ